MTAAKKTQPTTTVSGQRVEPNPKQPQKTTEPEPAEQPTKTTEE